MVKIIFRSLHQGLKILSYKNLVFLSSKFSLSVVTFFWNYCQVFTVIFEYLLKYYRHDVVKPISIWKLDQLLKFYNYNWFLFYRINYKLELMSLILQLWHALKRKKWMGLIYCIRVNLCLNVLFCDIPATVSLDVNYINVNVPGTYIVIGLYLGLQY